MADIKDLIGAIVNKDALAVKEIFSDIVGAKIGERMDALRPLVAADMFNEGKMKCEECGYGMAKEDSNCKKCGCSMNEDYDWDDLVSEMFAEEDDNVKDDADTVAKDHPLVQLKKIIDTKGGVFKTSTGKKVNLDHASAKRLLALHNATQKSEVKQKFASAVHRDPTGTHDKFFPNAKISEETELDEISDTLARNYERKADAQRRKLSNPYGHSPEDANTLRKRGEGKVSLVARRFTKVLGKKQANEESELDELSKNTLGSYAMKALNRGDIASRMSNSDSDGMGKIANKRFSGVKLAAKKMATKVGDKAGGTRVATNVDKARTAGMGASSRSNKDREDSGKAYYAAQRNITKLRNMGEESELDELSQDTLISYGQKAREAGGRTKGSAMAVKKILAARGKPTGVKVPASEETE